MLLLTLQAAGFLLVSTVAVSCDKDHVPFPSSNSTTYDCVEYKTAFQDAMQYLEKNLPSFDVINKGTLGFSDANQRSDSPSGIIPEGIALALKVRSVYSWAAEVPLDIFHEYVVPYASVNEARSSWRPVMLNAAEKIVLSVETFSDAVTMINQEIWSMFGNGNTNNIVFKASETPLVDTFPFHPRTSPLNYPITHPRTHSLNTLENIPYNTSSKISSNTSPTVTQVFDPMSVIVYGYASCTGISIFLTDALRSIGRYYQ